MGFGNAKVRRTRACYRSAHHQQLLWTLCRGVSKLCNQGFVDMDAAKHQHGGINVPEYYHGDDLDCHASRRGAGQ